MFVQKKLRKILYIGLFLILINNFLRTSVWAAGDTSAAGSMGQGQVKDIGCNLPNGKSACPKYVKDYYASYDDGQERCAEGDTFDKQLEDFNSDPVHVHLWVESPEITEQGKADERARQFIYWVLSHPSIDDHPTLKKVWGVSMQIALMITLFVATIFGIGIIIAQRQNFDLKIDVSPLIIKLVFMLLYIVFSAAIVLTIIQVSEMLMKFFIETLGGRDLFNIYFAGNSAEDNYIKFHGCVDKNWRVQEGLHAELFLLRLTNITYYVMGIMLLLRKILLWFLLFVSPFLALLMPFVFIRNTGWIWIGVFFQWVFYGPLFALFLGGLAQIWKNGIPFPFNFSRTNTQQGYIFPTAMNIAYGGPAQQWTADKPPQTNNGNYVDTFAEYIITLLMLWAITFFPWWLLRIFRDYCCDGIMAMKNILMSMYDQMRGGPSPTPGPVPTAPTPASTVINTTLNVPQSNIASVKLENIEEIKKAQTENITKSLEIKATKLTDIARYETNKTVNQTANKNIQYLQNPMKANTTTERQKYMNIRTELFNRSVKEDKIARQILTATSTSKIEQMQQRQEIVKTLPAMRPVTHLVSFKVQVPEAKVQSITNNLFHSLYTNDTVVNSIAQTTKVAQPQVKTILNSYTMNTNQPVNQIVNNISQQSNITKDTVRAVIKESNTLLTTQTTNTAFVNTIQQATGVPAQQVRHILQKYVTNVNQPIETTIENLHKETNIENEKIKNVINLTTERVKTSNNIIKEVAQKENVKEEVVKQIIASQVPLVVEPEKNIEQTVAVPPSVSLEDYEEVKKMWQEQYEKGEVPVTEDIQSRSEWVEKDIVLITNTLNKLMSVDEKVRQEGLDDVSYLLPIFMINNLSGEELMVYLKAKLEAAKAVLNKDKEKEEEKAQPEEEEVFVEASKKKEEAKTMTLEDAQEIPDEEKKEAGSPEKPAVDAAKPTEPGTETKDTKLDEEPKQEEPKQESNTQSPLPENEDKKLN